MPKQYKRVLKHEVVNINKANKIIQDSDIVISKELPNGNLLVKCVKNKK